MRRLLAHVLLVFALLAMQHGAAAHALTHVAGTPQQKDGDTPKSHSCDLCHAYAAADGVDTAPAGIALPVSPHGLASLPHPAAAHVAASSSPYSSRAPPLSC